MRPVALRPSFVAAITSAAAGVGQPKKTSTVILNGKMSANNLPNSFPILQHISTSSNSLSEKRNIVENNQIHQKPCGLLVFNITDLYFRITLLNIANDSFIVIYLSRRRGKDTPFWSEFISLKKKKKQQNT